MPNFDSGVSKYIIGRCKIEVGFPVDHNGKADISCKQCPYFRKNYNLCGLNGAVVNFPMSFVGDSCPLERVEEDA